MSISHDSETLAEGKQVITACALIHHDFDGVIKAFLPKRAATKKFLPGVFEMPGGHIDYGEALVDGLKREIMEELGMNISVGDPFAAFTYMNDIKRSHSVEIIYFAKFTDPIEMIKLDPEDHSEYIWVSLEEIEKARTPGKNADDNEFIALKHGLELLNGGQLRLS
jgi:8-oxo-dGTP diphosphatase